MRSKAEAVFISEYVAPSLAAVGVGGGIQINGHL